MLLREVRYGIRLGFTEVAVAPFGIKTFSYRVGNVKVDYAARRVSIEVPGRGSRAHHVTGMPAGVAYRVTRCDGSTHANATVDAGGVLRFEAPVGTGCTTVASAAAA